MALCDAKPLPDRVDQVSDVLAFLRESLCIGRELPFTEDAMNGAHLVFGALEDDLKDIRSHMASQPE